MTDFDIYQVAAFTDRPFGGNPAAVVPLVDWIEASLMQRIAAENNLSETAFLVPTGDSQWHIRWFTPTVEVDLCGHATLGSAAVIHSQLGHESWPITLESASGLLQVDVDAGRYILDFPAQSPSSIDAPSGLGDAIGASAKACFQGGDKIMVVLEDESAVAAVEPDFAQLAEIVEHGLIVTAPGDSVDFVSRFFAPAIGINEDPVTGSAHCVLTPYWSERLNKKSLEAHQISARVGHLLCEDAGERTLISGSAVFFLSGRIAI